MGDNAISSVDLFVRLLPFYLSNCVIFGFDLLRMCGSLTWLTGDWNWRSQVKVKTRLVSPETRKPSSLEDRGQTDHVLTLSLTLTCDLRFESLVSHGSDPHTCKGSRPKGQSVWKRVETDGWTDRWGQLHYLSF